jgi:hypothetical protein
VDGRQYGGCHPRSTEERGAAETSLDTIFQQPGHAIRTPAADPRDVIYAAIHSAFVKYPKEDDPASSDHWIESEQSAHLTKVVMLGLEANGFQILKKAPPSVASRATLWQKSGGSQCQNLKTLKRVVAL